MIKLSIIAMRKVLLKADSMRNVAKVIQEKLKDLHYLLSFYFKNESSNLRGYWKNNADLHLGTFNNF